MARKKTTNTKTGGIASGGIASLPFPAGEHKRIAIKIVDDRGIESLKVMEVA